MDNSLKEIIEKYSDGNVDAKISEEAKPWKGYRELVLVDKVKECEDIISFYFKSKDNKKLIKHIAGQFLPFKIKTDDSKYNGVLRTYSLSMKPNEDIYRISVKRVPGGLISNYLHDSLEIGDIIEALVPAGLFTIDKRNVNKPLVLLSAGIGITPLISMLYDSMSDFNNITFVQAVLNSKTQPFNYDIQEIKNIINLNSYVFYSNPLNEDKEGIDYNVKGFVQKEWIKENLPLDAEFYFCGPPPFMKNLNKSLIELGVSKDRIHYEFFGTPEEME